MKSASVPVALSVLGVHRLVNARGAIILRKLPTSHELSSASPLSKPVFDHWLVEAFGDLQSSGRRRVLRFAVSSWRGEKTTKLALTKKKLWPEGLPEKYLKVSRDKKPNLVFEDRHEVSKVILKTRGLCKSSQMIQVFPTVSPEILVREARIEDCWEVAETHCSSFFPEYSFPLNFGLRMDRLVGMLAGFSLPSGHNRVCLVAVTDCYTNEGFLFGNGDIRMGGLDGRFSLNKGYVAGILTVDTVADFLPRKGPLRQRRTGIAYVSNVAVREKFRRQGIAKKLMAKAETQARSWDCRAIALHCDMNNPGAIKLYKGQGFKCIDVPEGANWPRPKTSPDLRFNFMMKLL